MGRGRIRKTRVPAEREKSKLASVGEEMMIVTAVEEADI